MILGRGISSQARAPFFTRSTSSSTSTSLCVDNRTVLTRSLVQCSMFNVHLPLSSTKLPKKKKKKRRRRRRSCIIQIVDLEERRRWLTDTFRLGFFFFFFFFFNLYPVFENKSKFIPIGFLFYFIFFIKFLSKLSFKLFLYYFLFVNFKNLIVKLHILIISSMLAIF